MRSCMIFTANTKFCYGNAIKDGEMGGACSMCWGGDRRTQGFSGEA